ncbi:energy transducer TonB [candidate division TA06 bacterium]|nr:energy transducer TonB [candidate division TA06 bacterium]
MRQRFASLNEKYGGILKGSLLFALVFHLLGFSLLPGYEPVPIEITVLAPVDTLFWIPPSPGVPPDEPAPPEIPERGIPEVSEDTIVPIIVPPMPVPPKVVLPKIEEVILKSIGEVEILPKPLHIVKPEYPKFARMAGMEGVVVLKLILDVDGSVLDTEVIQSPHDALSRAAVVAAKSSRYTPAIWNGRPVRVWIAQTYRFDLRG